MSIYYYRARYYDPQVGRFLSEDPLGFEAGVNFYAYVGNNPVNRTDPTGHYWVVDDAAFIIGGALLGVAAQGAVDLWNGDASSLQDYAAAAVGGAFAGETLLYAGPVAAGAIGGTASNLTKQYLNIQSGNQTVVNFESLAIEAAVGAATGIIPGMKIQGITKGQGNYHAIYKQMVTKSRNGSISSVKPKTAAKMFIGRATHTSFLPGAITATASVPFLNSQGFGGNGSNHVGQTTSNSYSDNPIASYAHKPFVILPVYLKPQ